MLVAAYYSAWWLDAAGGAFFALFSFLENNSCVDKCVCDSDCDVGVDHVDMGSHRLATRRDAIWQKCTSAIPLATHVFMLESFATSVSKNDVFVVLLQLTMCATGFSH